MKHAVHDQPVRFRLSYDLLIEAEAKAERDGMTLSELIRQALRREVHCNPSSSNFARAARGDRTAQRGMIDVIETWIAGGHLSSRDGHIHAEYWARLAASDGEQSDKLRLVRVLAMRCQDELDAGKLDAANIFTAEGLAILSELADHGMVEAELWLNGSAALAGPAVCATAKQIEKLLTQRDPATVAEPVGDRSLGEILSKALEGRG